MHLVFRIALSMALLLLALSTPAASHGLRPVVSEVTVNENNVELMLNSSIEAIIAGMDLATLADTDTSPLAERYNALRAEDPAQLEKSLLAIWPQIAARITILAGQTRLQPEFVALSAPPVGDLSLPRLSDLQISAKLPDDGSPIQIGFDASFGSVVVRQMGGGEDAYTGMLKDGTLSVALPREGYAAEGLAPVIGRFIISGFEHIIPKGLDHILFVLGLFFYSLRLGPLLGQVTAFTLAHTVTLATASLGIFTLPGSIVEPLIAASIVYVAVENIFGTKDVTAGQSRVSWARIAVVFAFGLLHGLGFASVLSDVGLPEGRFIVALIGFNIGVELGQLAVIAVAFVLLALPFGKQSWYRSVVAIPASCLIALIGAWWTYERLFL